MHLRLSPGDKTLVNLKYSTFVDSLVATFPEIKGKYDLVQEDIGPDILPTWQWS